MQKLGDAAVPATGWPEVSLTELSLPRTSWVSLRYGWAWSNHWPEKWARGLELLVVLRVWVSRRAISLVEVPDVPGPSSHLRPRGGIEAEGSEPSGPGEERNINGSSREVFPWIAVQRLSYYRR